MNDGTIPDLRDSVRGEYKKLLSEKTNRGFQALTFKDRYGHECSLQKSSLATENAVWFGIDDPDPKIMASTAEKMGREDILSPPGTPERLNGWVKWPIPDDVVCSTRMHLTQDQVQEILPYLVRFAATGRLYEA